MRLDTISTCAEAGVEVRPAMVETPFARGADPRKFIDSRWLARARKTPPSTICPFFDARRPGSWQPRLAKSRGFYLIGSSCFALEAAMDRFILRANLERYRQLLARTTDEEARRQLLKLLAEEEAKGHASFEETGKPS
jgi:hypothetical protein